MEHLFAAAEAWIVAVLFGAALVIAGLRLLGLGADFLGWYTIFRKLF